MKYDLQSYVKQYKNFLTNDECIDAVNMSNNLYWEKHQYYDPVTKKFISSGDTELDNVWPDSSFIYKDIVMERLWYSIRQYVEELDFPWFSDWQGYMDIRLNRYNTENKMNNHCDHIHTLFDGTRKGIPILTLLGCLNNDFEGGDFIMWDNEKINLKQGDLLIFPSVFLYPHRVEPVTRGTRYSFVSWVW